VAQHHRRHVHHRRVARHRQRVCRRDGCHLRLWWADIRQGSGQVALGHDGHRATRLTDDQRRDVVSAHDPGRLAERCLGRDGDCRPEPKIPDPGNNMGRTLGHELISPRGTGPLPGPKARICWSPAPVRPAFHEGKALSSVSSGPELVSTTAAVGQGSSPSNRVERPGPRLAFAPACRSTTAAPSG
jgi:hypothetical protein